METSQIGDFCTSLWADAHFHLVKKYSTIKICLRPATVVGLNEQLNSIPFRNELIMTHSHNESYDNMCMASMSGYPHRNQEISFFRDHLTEIANSPPALFHVKQSVSSSSSSIHFSLARIFQYVHMPSSTHQQPFVMHDGWPQSVKTSSPSYWIHSFRCWGTFLGVGGSERVDYFIVHDYSLPVSASTGFSTQSWTIIEDFQFAFYWYFD